MEKGSIKPSNLPNSENGGPLETESSTSKNFSSEIARDSRKNRFHQTKVAGKA